MKSVDAEGRRRTVGGIRLDDGERATLVQRDGGGQLGFVLLCLSPQAEGSSAALSVGYGHGPCLNETDAPRAVSPLVADGERD